MGFFIVQKIFFGHFIPRAKKYTFLGQEAKNSPGYIFALKKILTQTQQTQAIKPVFSVVQLISIIAIKVKIKYNKAI